MSVVRMMKGVGMRRVQIPGDVTEEVTVGPGLKEESGERGGHAPVVAGCKGRGRQSECL